MSREDPVTVTQALNRNENHEGLAHDFVRISSWGTKDIADRVLIDPLKDRLPPV